MLRLVAALALVSAAAHAQGTVSFVLGSDTSTPGIGINEREVLYHNTGFDLFLSPTGNAARAMDPALRAAHRDAEGRPFVLTWWMQNGSLYRDALNTNVPLPSTMSMYLMRTARGDAIAAAGDELTLHYHTWVWNDDDGDGRYRWNQARAFTDAVRDDFDQTIADGLLMEGVYPASFRSGWHFMDNAWQAHLDRRFPFSLHNDAPHVHDDRVEPIDNLYDWSRAPLAFVPFRPSAEDYQQPGGTGGWNVRSRSFSGVTDDLVRGIFEAARAGDDQVACFWDHLAEPTFVGRLEDVLATIERVAADFPDVPFHYDTGTGAMQRWRGTDDRTPPALTLDALGDGRYRVTSDEPIFQDAPFVAVLDRYDRRRILPVAPAGALAWETIDALDPDDVARLAAAATDSAGNVATQFVRPLPDDLYADDADAGYTETGAGWQTLGPSAVDHVWGRTGRTVVLADGATAAARWTLTPERTGRYQAFVRVPHVSGLAAAGVTMSVSVSGAEVASTTFEEGPTENAWLFVGTVDVPAGAPVTVEVRASGTGQPGAHLAADAVKLSARIRDRQLVAPPALDLGDALYGQETTVTVRLQNRGVEPLTVRELRTASGVLRPAEALPVQIGGMEARDVPLIRFASEPGAVRDTLVIVSDDPTAAERRVPVDATFLDAFVIVDNDDGAGYAEQGDWRTSNAQAHGASSRYAFVTVDRPVATFFLTAPEAGVYAVEYVVPDSDNAAVRADYTVTVEGAERATVRVDQTGGEDRWRLIQTVSLNADDAVEVRVVPTDADQPNRVLRADAVRLLRLGDALTALILDDADGEAYRETGPWQASVAQAYGASSRFAPASSDARATFETTARRSGPHLVSFIVPETVNASPQARYRILRNDVLLGERTVDQNDGSGAWQSLGAWTVQAGDRLGVEVSNAETTASNRVLRADAVRVEYAASTATAEAPDAGVELSALAPNPAHDRVRFTVSLPVPAEAVVEVFDALGRRVATPLDGVLDAGAHTVALDLSTWAAGVYLCRLRTDGVTVTRVWTVAR